MPVVADSPTRLDHTLDEDPVLHELPGPQVLDQLVLRDRMVTVFHKIGQDFEGQGFERTTSPA